MRLTQRLLLGFGVLIGLLIVAGGIIAVLSNRTAEDFTAIARVSQPITETALQMQLEATNLGVHVEEYLRIQSSDARRRVLDDIASFEARLSDYRTLVANTPEAAIAEQVGVAFANLRQAAILRIASNDIQGVIFESATTGLDEIALGVTRLQAAVPSEQGTRSMLLNELREQLLTLTILLGRYQALPTAALEIQLANALEVTQQTFSTYRGMTLSAEETSLLRAVVREFGYVVLEVPYVSRLAADINRFEATFFQQLTTLESLFQEQVVTAANRTSAAATQRAADSAALTQTALLALLAGSVIVGASATYFITRHVSSGVNSLKRGAEAIGSGDLAYRIPDASPDELGELATAFNNMAEKAQANIQHLETARREAEYANRMKDLFMATMSHELRTPLNAMIGFLNLMLYSGQLNDDNLHMANRSLANSHRLLTLINNILDLSRIATGAIQVVATQTSPRELTAALYNDMKPLAQEKGLELDMQVAADVPTKLYHDGDRIMQIITNLTHNAIKFTQNGTVKVNVGRSGERLLISVSDTGIGIPKSKQHLIFDDFFQVDPTSTRQHQGAGLGLAIVKRLALMMNGSITVNSEIDQGSTFTVDLPLNLPMSEVNTRETRTAIALPVKSSNGHSTPVPALN
jgi:signal transduction histidine kinase